MWREHRFLLWATLAYCAVLEVLLVGAILFWPSFAENVESLKAMAPMQVLKDMVDKLGVGGVAAYVHGQHFFKGCNTVGSLAAVVFSFGAVAGEAQRGTLELWLSRPLSRRRILLERWVAGALAVAIPVFVTTATIPWLLTFVDEEMQLPPLLLCAAQQSLLLLSIYSLTFWYSTMSARPTQIAFVMLMLTIVQFSLYMIKDVTHWSLFRLTDIDVFARISASRSLDLWRAAPLALFSACCVALSLVCFARRVP